MAGKTRKTKIKTRAGNTNVYPIMAFLFLSLDKNPRPANSRFAGFGTINTPETSLIGKNKHDHLLPFISMSCKPVAMPA